MWQHFRWPPSFGDFFLFLLLSKFVAIGAANKVAIPIRSYVPLPSEKPTTQGNITHFSKTLRSTNVILSGGLAWHACVSVVLLLLTIFVDVALSSGKKLLFDFGAWSWKFSLIFRRTAFAFGAHKSMPQILTNAKGSGGVCVCVCGGGFKRYGDWDLEMGVAQLGLLRLMAAGIELTLMIIYAKWIRKFLWFR